MIIFQFKDTDAAIRFLQVCAELGLDTAKEREEILAIFALNGEMSRVQETNRTREQIIEDWSKEYRILDLSKEKTNER